MKTICLYFEIHLLNHLRRYRFFDIGTDHYYYDDYENERSAQYFVETSYKPALDTLHTMLLQHPDTFRVAFSLSGIGIEQLEQYAPELIEKLQAMNSTGRVEFLAEPYSHGLASLTAPENFADEVRRQCNKMEELFGQRPTVLRNSSLIYDDEIGRLAARMGFKGVLTEGAKHVLGWRSPHFVYHCPGASKVRLLLRDYTLSDDISLRFSDTQWEGYPLLADNFMQRIAQLPEEEQVVNIFMNLSAIGIAQPLASHITDFLQALPQFAGENVTFATPSEVISSHPSVGPLAVPEAISWLDEERDLSPFLGNAMQKEAFDKLYSVAERVQIANDPQINEDWVYLQASDNFRFMSTKHTLVDDGRYIYSDPFDAFTNYMNILGDFLRRVQALYPDDIDNDELNSLLTTIRNQGDEIEQKNKTISRLQAKITKMKGTAKTDKKQGKA
ncbi:MAG: glycoside hydrolase family 57 protein [Bacteroidaceae bacterium]|nr:glycoside hydrolase family 57 protein [Bacteroidaceae bacterium]